ncbi:hypothetical protein D0469_14570 [Peribacillus saganii]|uniref:Uncharacterized protein n=1 Tax=Peribacillus saganii TaxID=2303992 RepID=A0A372LM91_9BACI|nr:hypothetical protein [Peribacillus saganii]RFU67476.1 hypothetical protein D0469_14570 [Peribacillus saganii]
MKNLKLEAETIQISIYCEIILRILSNHKHLSVNKMLVFAYLIKKDRFIPRKIYNGNNTQDIIYKCISMLSGDYREYCNNIEFILKAIHLLNKNKLVLIENNILQSCTESIIDLPIYEESMFLEKAIKASQKMTEKQFMKEVTHIV